MGDRAHAVALFNQGVTSSNNKSNPVYLQHAYSQFVSACYADPSWWQAHYQAGNNATDLKHYPAAVACHRRALECEMADEERSKVLSNMGELLTELGEIDDAKEASHQARKLAPRLAHPYHNLSRIALLQNDPVLAVKTARITFDMKPEPTSEALLAFALLFNREFKEGFKHFECRFEWRLHQYNHYPYAEGRWQGDPDKTIFLVADQGLGDTLSFARFVPLACQKAKYVHACVQPELLRLFQHAFVGIKNLNLMPSPSPFPPADQWTTFVSLPFALGLSDEQIRTTSQIKVPVFDVPKSWKVGDRKFHIGIAWSGSVLNDIDRWRNVPVTQFLELGRVPGVQLYGLQVDAKKEDMHQAGCAAVIRDLSGYISDVTSTISLLNDLDLVISVESALGHICAAAGKECWIPMSFMGRDYRIGCDGSDMIWTPKHRIFRQEPDLQWGPVFEKLNAALEERIRAKTA